MSYFAVKAIDYKIKAPAFTEDPSLDRSCGNCKDTRQQRLEQFPLRFHIYFVMKDQVYMTFKRFSESSKPRGDFVSPNSDCDMVVGYCYERIEAVTAAKPSSLKSTIQLCRELQCMVLVSLNLILFLPRLHTPTLRFVHIVPHPKGDLSAIEESRKEQEGGFRMEHSMMGSDK